jgi:hypothetical protein
MYGTEWTTACLARYGISIDAVTAQLTEEGVQQFSDASEKLLSALTRKCAAVGGKLNTH